MKPIPIKMLQYQCESCEFKFYINLEDNLGEWIKCPKCNLEKALRKRIFEMVINDFKPYK